MTRLDGKLIRVTLGKHATLSLADAREEARRVVTLAAAGKDPRQIRSEAKQKRREERRNSFDVCADEFCKDTLKGIYDRQPSENTAAF